MYDWREMTENERAQVLEMRKERHLPWHSPPHWEQDGELHGCVTQWQHWPWSSAGELLRQVGRDRAVEIWKKYPRLDYGKKWDR